MKESTMFNFANDMTALLNVDAGQDLNQSLPRWYVLFGSHFVFIAQ
jgi:hypothetical protein